MKKFISILLFAITLAAFSVNAQDTVKAPLLSATEDEIVKFIAAFPEFLKENKDLNPADPGSVNAVMTTIAANKDKWEAFAKDRGFASYENFMQVSAAVTTAYAYQLLQHNAEKLEKQIPEGFQGKAKDKLLKPVKEQISQYGKMISPVTLELVKKHEDQLQEILIPTGKIKLKKK
jgi:putative lipoic acid-binding regulatory protein